MRPNKLSELMRVDKDLKQQLRKVIPKRIRNFPEENPRELTDRELTRMLKNTSSFPASLKELEKLPRRKNLI